MATKDGEVVDYIFAKFDGGEACILKESLTQTEI